MNIYILTTGNLLNIPGVLAFENCLMDIMSRTQRKFYVAMYVISIHYEVFWKNLERMLEDGIQVRILIEGKIKHDPEMLKRFIGLKEKYRKNFEWKMFMEEAYLHTKLILSDSERIIIGSANITGKGLFSNQEIGVYIEDKKTGWLMEKLFLMLWQGK